MASTYIVSTNLNDSVCAQERLQVYQDPTNGAIDPTLVGFPNQESVVEAAAAFALWNGKGSNITVKIVDLSLNEVQGRTGAAVLWDMVRISAVSGGLDEVVIPLDSGGTAFPSGISVLRRVNFTQSGGSFRRTSDLPQLNPTRAVTPGAFRLHGGGPFSQGTGGVLSSGFSDVQPIVLREGEGMAFVVANNAGNVNWPIEICVWMDVGGETYMTRRVGHPESFGAALAVFNNSGSGVVVSILRVVTSELMTDQNVAVPLRFTLETISGIGKNSGSDAMTPTPMDSANAALPSEIVVESPSAVLQLNKDSLLASSVSQRDDSFPLRRLAKVSFGISPGLASSLLALQALGSSASCNSVFGGVWDQGFVLRPGEGIGLFQRDLSGGYGQGYWLRVVFTVEPTVEQYAGSALNGSVVRGTGGNAVL